MQRPRTSVSTSQRQIRGLRSENNEVISYPGSARPATPGKNVLARPPSSLAAFSHVTRLGTRGGGSFGPGGGGERPITQYGVAGMRPGTGRGMMRQIQDKRYYLSLLQLKIRDLGQEIATILRDVEAQTKEKAKFHHFDKLAKDLAIELTNLQSELADYNTVVDKLTSDVSKDEIEQETFELAAKNQENQLRIEELLDKRFKIQENSRQIFQTIEDRNKSGAILVSKMAAEERGKFESLQAKKNNLNLILTELQNKLNKLNLIEENLDKEIGNSDLKQEMAKLELKLNELENRKSKLLKEERNQISPEEEKEKILAKVRMENLQISAAEAQLNELRKKIQDGERLFERLQIETEENESEKKLKFKELKKREFLIEDFMGNFEFNKEGEKKKMEKLQNLILENLTKISKNPILAGFGDNLENLEDFEVDEEFILKSGENFGNFGNIGNNIENIGNNRNNIENNRDDRNNQNFENNHENSQNTQNNTQNNPNNTQNNPNFEDFENQLEKWQKLKNFKIQLEILQNRLESELKHLNLTNLTNLTDFEPNLSEKIAKLNLQNEELKNSEKRIEKELNNIKIEFENGKKIVNNNELVNEINELQIKEENLKVERRKIEDLIEKEKNGGNFEIVKKNAVKLVGIYNNSIKDGLKNIFVN